MMPARMSSDRSLSRERLQQTVRRSETLGSARTGGTAEDHDVADGVAAQTVGAVDAARRFAGGVETRNDLAVDVKHLSLGVDLQAAHRVVHGRDLLAGVPRAFSHQLVSLVVGHRCRIHL